MSGLETPLDLESWLVACRVVGQQALESFGMKSALKCVSCKKIMSALFLCPERSNWERSSGMLRPRAF